MASLRAEIATLRRRIPTATTETPYLDAVSMAGVVGLELDAWQEDLLRTEETQIILNVARQLGKSTATSVLALHDCLFASPALVLVVCPALRQAREFFEKFRSAYHRLPQDMRVPLLVDQALEWKFANGSRVVCIPDVEATVRGFSAATRIIVDEASRVADSLYFAVRPMLAVSGGKIMLLSTPAGQRGFFFETWGDHDGDSWREVRDGWKRILVTAWQCPRISEQFLMHERANLPDAIFEQEYECKFREVEGSVFGYADVMGAVDPTVTPLFGSDAADTDSETLKPDGSILPLFGGFA